MIENIAAYFGVKKSVFLAALLGAAVSMWWTDAIVKWVSKLAYLAFGAVMGMFGGSVVSPWVSLSDRSEVGLALVIGIFGMNLCDKVNETIKQTKLAELLPWFKK